MGQLCPLTIHDRNDKGEHEKGHGPGDVMVEVKNKDLELINLLYSTVGNGEGSGGEGLPSCLIHARNSNRS